MFFSLGRRFGVIILSSLVWFATSASAGPWGRTAGETFVLSQVESFKSTGDGRSFEQILYRQYAELGITEKITVGGQWANADQRATGSDEINLSSGTVEAEGFLTWHFDRRGNVASGLQLSGGAATTLRIREDRIMGQDAFLGLSYMIGRGGDRVFADTDVGLRGSLGNDADQLRVNARLGLKRDRAMLLLQTFNTKSLGGQEGDGLDFDLGQVSLSAVLPLRQRLSMELGGRVDTFTSKIDRGKAYFVALWWSL